MNTTFRNTFFTVSLLVVATPSVDAFAFSSRPGPFNPTTSASTSQLQSLPTVTRDINTIFRNTCFAACILTAATPSAEAFASLSQPGPVDSTTLASTSQLVAADGVEDRLALINKDWKTLWGGNVLKKSLAEDIREAEKLVVDALAAAESVVDTITQSSSPISSVQSIKAANSVAEAAAASAAADASAVRGLGSAVDDVSRSIMSALKAIESIVPGGGKDSMAALESSAADVTKSMNTASSVAAAVSDVASKDSAAVAKLESAELALAKVVSASKPSSTSLDAAKTSVIKEMNDAEAAAKTAATGAANDAKAVASLDSKAADAIQSIKNVESAIEKASGGDANAVAALNSAKADAVAKIKDDGKAVDVVAQAVAKDAAAGASAVETLKTADAGVNVLIKSAEAAK